MKRLGHSGAVLAALLQVGVAHACLRAGAHSGGIDTLAYSDVVCLRAKVQVSTIGVAVTKRLNFPQASRAAERVAAQAATGVKLSRHGGRAAKAKVAKRGAAASAGAARAKKGKPGRRQRLAKKAADVPVAATAD